MVLVDSSVWIDHINRVSSEPVRRLRELVPEPEILVGDLILCEVLQGIRNEAYAQLLERSFRRFEMVSLADPELAIRVAANYRRLRGFGFTVRKTVDLFICTFCIARGHALLHDDRDFAPMERFLGLQSV